MIRFAVIGITHGHIYSQVNTLLQTGATLVAWFAFPSEHSLSDGFVRAYPAATRVADERAILDDATIQMVVTAAIPADRAAICIRAMRHGKDVMSDKPGATTFAHLADLRRTQAETGRIYSICFSERFESRATVRAGELVRAGAIGRVLQTIGLGPHRLNASSRLPYFFQAEHYGGILCDIGSHQFDQFLFFSGATNVEIVASQVGNLAHPEHPGLEDFGDAVFKGMTPGGPVSGYIRLDWFTPAGLPAWGDGRLTILGSEGYIELRKYIDIEGRPGGDHLYLANAAGTRYIDCRDVTLTYGSQLVHDVLNRTETAMSQAHCFYATELALVAQARAVRM